MKLVEKACATCGSPIYIYEGYTREEMFCTLHCMERSTVGSARGLDQLKTVC